MVKRITLKQIAYGRSGDKGNSVNIGIIAYSTQGYDFLKDYLTDQKVGNFFKPLGVTSTIRYDLPNLLAFNFILFNALDGGGSLSLRIDPQGKALGQALLEMIIEVPDEIIHN